METTKTYGECSSVEKEAIDYYYDRFSEEIRRRGEDQIFFTWKEAVEQASNNELSRDPDSFNEDADVSHLIDEEIKTFSYLKIGDALASDEYSCLEEIIEMGELYFDVFDLDSPDQLPSDWKSQIKEVSILTWSVR